MNESDIEQAQLLDRYWTEIRQGSLARLDGLDPEVASLVERLEANMRPPEPDPRFAAELYERLEKELATTGQRVARVVPSARKRQGFPRRLWPVAAAVATVLLIAMGAMNLWVEQPQQVSAAEIMEKAERAAANPALSNVTSVEIVSTSTWAVESAEGNTTGTLMVHEWFRAPGQARIESRRTDGANSVQRVTVANGGTVWRYDRQQNSVQITEGQIAAFEETRASSLWDALQGAVQSASSCYTPTLAREEEVAGRAAYVVEMGASTCPSASMPDTNGPLIVWLDKETFFVLKSELRDKGNARTVLSSVVSSIVYNKEIDDKLFEFVPPAGAEVIDKRPRLIVSSEQMQQQLEALAPQADFPLLAPGQAPDGMMGRQPSLDSQNGLVIEYVPSSDTSAISDAAQKGISIREQKATYALLTRWTQAAEPTTLTGAKAWIQRDSGNSTGTGGNVVVMLLRDGTFVTIESAVVPSEQLLDVAASLVPVPGGHAPIAEPMPPTLGEVRTRVSYAVFVPTYIPEGLTPAPPIGGEEPQDRVEIEFYAQDGSQALLVLNGPAGCCLDAGGLSTGTGELIDLPNGTVAHYLPGVAESGGPILWWDDEGTYVALSGPHLDKESLVRIAGSMSESAELYNVETAP